MVHQTLSSSYDFLLRTLSSVDLVGHVGRIADLPVYTQSARRMENLCCFSSLTFPSAFDHSRICPRVSNLAYRTQGPDGYPELFSRLSSVVDGYAALEKYRSGDVTMEFNSLYRALSYDARHDQTWRSLLISDRSMRYRLGVMSLIQIVRAIFGERVSHADVRHLH